VRLRRTARGAAAPEAKGAQRKAVGFPHIKRQSRSPYIELTLY